MTDITPTELMLAELAYRQAYEEFKRVEREMLDAWHRLQQLKFPAAWCGRATKDIKQHETVN